DPIHPIIPVAPNIPPITPAPLIGRIDRDGRRRGPDEDRRRRQPRPDDATSQTSGERDDEGEMGLHVDVTA
ncbi:MAG TPA: hypothetical protein VLC49_14640, partial [Solirubrobacteraceae bacterium]|nr:hypothetical protein [Solirubrobacteraceae bacterium]